MRFFDVSIFETWHALSSKIKLFFEVKKNFQKIDRYSPIGTVYVSLKRFLSLSDTRKVEVGSMAYGMKRTKLSEHLCAIWELNTDFASTYCDDYKAVCGRMIERKRDTNRRHCLTVYKDNIQSQYITMVQTGKAKQKTRLNANLFLIMSGGLRQEVSCIACPMKNEKGCQQDLGTIVREHFCQRKY